MRVLLVNMPWAPIDLPSLALGILKRSVDERVPNGSADVLHANLEYVDWITRNTEFTLEDYSYYALGSYFLGCGDWVFSSALYDDPEWRVPEFTEAMSGRVRGARMDMTRALHSSAPDFVRYIAERIVELDPDVVGFTSTFQQNTAALAAAKYVKRLAPHIATAMGGANCDASRARRSTATSPSSTTSCAVRGRCPSPRCSPHWTPERRCRRFPGCAGAVTTARPS